MKKKALSNFVHHSWIKFFLEKQGLIENIWVEIEDRFTPSSESIFKIFKDSKENTRFVVIGQDPYPQPGHATGRSFEREIDNWKEANTSLQAILASIYYHEIGKLKSLSEILTEIDRGRYTPLKPKEIFKEWEAQKGVFFLNKSLTTEIGKRNAHVELWRPFTEALVKDLSKDHSIKWFLWGKEAQELEAFIEDKSSIVKTIHPAAFSYIGGEESQERLKRFVRESGIDLILNAEPINQAVEMKDESEIDKRIRALQLEIDRLQNLKSSNEIQEYTDPVISELNQEIERLENELDQLEAEKVEAEKLISDFNYRFNLELGDLILEILELKKFIVKEDKEKFEEAKAREEQFKQQVFEEKQRAVKELNKEDADRLKSLRNKAAKLCHPDKFQNESEEIKSRANEISQELNEAYRNNNIERVEHLLRVLESGELIPIESSEDQEKESLKLRVEQLKLKIVELNSALAELIESETYQKVANIEDWDMYFENLKSELESELQRLKDEVEDSKGSLESEPLELENKKEESNTSTKQNNYRPKVVVSNTSKDYNSGIQYKPCPECGSMHNAAYNRCAVCNDFDASNDPYW